jgi:PKD repeat protein
MRLRELFRQKLGNAEIIPSAEVKISLMRKLAFHEFLRFNIARFNIYYVGVVIVAGITASMILSHVKNLTPQVTELGIPAKYVEKAEVLNSDSSAKPVQHEKSITEKKVTVRQINSKVLNREESFKGDNKEQSQEKPEKEIVSTSASGGTLSKKDLFSQSSPDNSKLKSGLASDKAMFVASVTRGCTPLDVKFYNGSESFDSCRWSFGDGGYSGKINPEWIFDLDGDYKVELTIFKAGGSQETYSQVITVYPKPQARFETAPEKPILPDDEIRFFNYSSDAIHFSWDFGDGTKSELFEPRHKYANFGKYNLRLVATSDQGCSDSLVVLNAFSGSEYFIDFPNAFIPNAEGPTGGYYSSKSDETAQVFHPGFSGVSEYNLKIFSKIGILIFESNDISIGWDGYFKGKLCEPGVYIWKVRGKFRNGEPFIKMGDVTLLRN